MATPHPSGQPDNFIRVLQALQYVCDKALPSLEAVIKSWQASQIQSIQSCNSKTCLTKVKPKQPSSCTYCVQWGKAVENVYYPQPQPTSKGAVPISWKNVDPTLLGGKDSVEVANAFALHLPQGQRPPKFEDYDTASVLKIMSGFGEYHRNNAAVGQFSDPYKTIKKVNDIRNDLAHYKLEKNLYLDDQTLNSSFRDIKNLVSCLESFQHFTSQQADINRSHLDMVRTSPVLLTAEMQQAINDVIQSGLKGQDHQMKLTVAGAIEKILKDNTVQHEETRQLVRKTGHDATAQQKETRQLVRKTGQDSTAQQEETRQLVRMTGQDATAQQEETRQFVRTTGQDATVHHEETRQLLRMSGQDIHQIKKDVEETKELVKKKTGADDEALTTEIKEWRQCLKRKYIKDKRKIRFGKGSKSVADSDDIFVDLELLPINDESKTDQPDQGIFETVQDFDRHNHLNSYHDLLRLSSQDGPSHLILISGNAGSGKTTLISRIAYQWAINFREEDPLSTVQNEEDIWNQFKLVLVLDIRKFKEGVCLEEVIRKHLLPAVSVDKIAKVISVLKMQCLILLDGFDEMCDDVWQSEDHALESPHLDDSFVIVTTRPHEKDRFCVKYEGYVLVHNYGFGPHGAKKSSQYIDSFFAKFNRPDLALKLQMKIAETPSLKILSSSPILLVMMCLLWCDESDDTFANTLTGLYEKAICYLNKPFTQKADVNKTEEVVIKIGKVALKGVFQGIVQLDRDCFDDEEVLLDSFEIGLCSQEDGACVGEESVIFIHQTFQEFCAAKYLDSLLTNDHAQFVSQLQSIEVYSMDYLLRFCCGLSVRLAEAILSHVIELMLNSEGRFLVNWSIPLTMLYEAEVRNVFLENKYLHSLLKPLEYSTLILGQQEYQALVHFATKSYGRNLWMIHVQEFTIWAITLDCNHLMQILRFMKSLKRLKLYKVHLDGVLDATKSVPCISIAYICFENVTLCVNTLVRLLGYMQCLRTVNIIKTNLIGELSASIVLCESVTEFGFGDKRVSNYFGRSYSLYKGCHSLDTVNANTMLRLLGCMPSLAKLQLTCVRITGVMDSDIPVQMKSLKYFNMSDSILSIHTLMKYVSCMAKLNNMSLYNVNLLAEKWLPNLSSVSQFHQLSNMRINSGPSYRNCIDQKTCLYHSELPSSRLVTVGTDNSYGKESHQITFQPTQMASSYELPCMLNIDLCREFLDTFGQVHTFENVTLLGIDLVGVLHESNSIGFKSIKRLSMSQGSVNANVLIQCLCNMPSIEALSVYFQKLGGKLDFNSHVLPLIHSLKHFHAYQLFVRPEVLTSLMKCMPSLERLRLQNIMNRPTKESYDMILSFGKTLKNVSLSGMGRVSKYCAISTAAVATFLSSAPSLESIDLRNIHLSGEIPHTLEMGRCNSIRLFEISRCTLSIHTLVQCLQCMSSLLRLEFVDNYVEGELDRSVATGSICNMVQNVTIYNSVFTFNTLMTFLSLMSSLKSVTLKKIPTGERDKNLSSQCIDIKCFSLRRFTFNINTIMNYISCTPQVQRIILKDFKILESQTSVITPRPLQCLTIIKLVNGSSNIGILIRLFGIMPSLESVEFDNFDIGGELDGAVHGVCNHLTRFTFIKGSAGTVAALRLLCSMPTLQQVEFDNVLLTGEVDGNISSDCPSVKLLTLKSHGVSANTVIQFLSVMPNVETFTVSNIKNVATELPAILCNKLKLLNMSESDLSANAMIGLLERMPSLESITLDQIVVNGIVTKNLQQKLTSLTRFDASQFTVEANTLSKLFNMMPVLQKPSLKGINVIGKFDRNVSTGCVGVKEFTLENAELSVQSLLILMSSMISLKLINLENITLTGDLDANVSPHCRSLETLHMKCISSQDEATAYNSKTLVIHSRTFMRFFECLPNLAEVHIKQVDVTGGVDPQEVVKCKSIRDFKLSGIISVRLLAMLIDHMEVLEKIVLSKIELTGELDQSDKFQCNSVKEIHVRASHAMKLNNLFRFIQCMPEVQVIDLSEIDFKGELDQSDEFQCNSVKEIYVHSDHTMKLNNLFNFIQCMPAIHVMSLKTFGPIIDDVEANVTIKWKSLTKFIWWAGAISKISSKSLLRLLGGMPSLENVQLHGIEPVGDVTNMPICVIDNSEGKVDPYVSQNWYVPIKMTVCQCILRVDVLVRVFSCIPFVNEVILEKVELKGRGNSQCLVEIKSVKCISMTNGTTSASSLLSLFSCLPSLTTVSLGCFDMIDLDDKKLIACNSVKTVYVGGSRREHSIMDSGNTLIHFLNCMVSLEQLSLDSIDIHDLSNTNAHHGSVKSLDMTAVCGDSLIGFLASFPSLKKLTCKEIRFTGENDMNVTLHKLKVLELSAEESVRANTMFKLFRCMPNLERAALTGVTGVLHTDDLVSCELLRCFSLSQGTISAKTLVRFLSCMSALEYITMSNVIVPGILEQGTMLDLRCVKEFNVPGCTISVDVVMTIMASMSANINYLNLSGNHIGSDGLAKLVKAIVSRGLPNLQYLNLARTEIDSEAVTVLAESFKHMPALTNLNLSANTSIGPEGVDVIFKHLLDVKNLETLNLRGIYFSKSQCMPFPKFHSINKSYDDRVFLDKICREEIELLMNMYTFQSCYKREQTHSLSGNELSG